MHGALGELFDEIGCVPWSLHPDVEIASASSDIGTTSIYPVISYVNDTTTLWVRVVDNHNGNLVGSMSYPIASRTLKEELINGV